MENSFKIFIEVSISCSIFILFFTLISPFLTKRYTARMRVYIWLFIAIRLLIPMKFSLMPEKIDQISVPATVEKSQFINSINKEKSQIDNIPYVLPELTLTKDINIWRILTILWISVTILYLVLQFIFYIRFRLKIKYRRLPLEIKKLDTNKILSIYYSDLIDSPALIGIFKSIIILPHNEYSQDELEYILHHEVTHHLHRDIIFKCIVMFAKSIHWFNPFVYLLSKQINKDIELSCDESVIKDLSLEKRSEYAETIISTIPVKNKFIKLNLTTNFNERKSDMKFRIKSIFDTKTKKRGYMAIAITALMVTNFGGVVSVFSNDNSEYIFAAEDKTGIKYNDNNLPVTINYSKLKIEKDGYKWPYLTHNLTNNTDKTIIGYELTCLAYDKDGNPLDLYWQAYNVDENGGYGNVGTGANGVDYGNVVGIKPYGPKSYEYTIGQSADIYNEYKEYVEEYLKENPNDIDTIGDSLIETLERLTIQPNSTQEEYSGGWVLFDGWWDQPNKEHKVKYVLSEIKQITFEDGTIWNNPDYAKWEENYKAKKVDVDFLKSYYTHNQ